MIQTYHHGRFEFFLAATIISIVVFFGLGRYSFIANDARALRMKIISHHFMTGVANVRVQFLLANLSNEKSTIRYIIISGQKFYFSDQGWPTSVSGPPSADYLPTDDDCYHLWHLALQNPPPITKGRVENFKNYRLFADSSRCRYESTDHVAHFDYYPSDGTLIFLSNGNDPNIN